MQTCLFTGPNQAQQRRGAGFPSATKPNTAICSFRRSTPAQHYKLLVSYAQPGSTSTSYLLPGYNLGQHDESPIFQAQLGQHYRLCVSKAKPGSASFPRSNLPQNYGYFRSPRQMHLGLTLRGASFPHQSTIVNQMAQAASTIPGSMPAHDTASSPHRTNSVRQVSDTL